MSVSDIPQGGAHALLGPWALPLDAGTQTGNSPCAEQTGTCPRAVPIQSSTFGEVTTNTVLLGQQMGKILSDI